MAAQRVGDHAVSERYVRQERLGSGGSGVVWRAHDTLLRRDVALKEIYVPAMLDEQEQSALREKVLREARAAARLSHPGLVAVYDVAEEDGRPVIVMELVAAPTLAELVARDGPLDDAHAAAIGLEVLDALNNAHEHSVVHRDVKPANVMVHESGRVQLADFGVASVVDDPRVTGSGRMAGSPSYMSPEQAQGLAVGPATDLWGLGATLYFAVEGHAPYGKDTAIATLTSVVSDEPRPMEHAGRLAPLIGDLLAKEPADRPPVPEVRRRLQESREGQAAAAATTATATVAEAEAGSPTQPFRTEDPPSRNAYPPNRGVGITRTVPPPRPRQRPPVGGILAILLVIVLAAIAIAAVVRSQDTTTNPGGTTETTAAAPAGSEAPAVPDGWTAYEDPSTGFKIAYPSDWSVRRNGTLTDFRDPSVGAYLRVDHKQPPGPSPEGAWEALEASFAPQYGDYRRIRLTPTTYKGYDAAIWEFTYSDGGARLRALDLGFIAGDYGFALLFQTHADDWDRLQPVFEQFKATFEPPG